MQPLLIVSPGMYPCHLGICTGKSGHRPRAPLDGGHGASLSARKPCGPKLPRTEWINQRLLATVDPRAGWLSLWILLTPKQGRVVRLFETSPPTAHIFDSLLVAVPRFGPCEGYHHGPRLGFSLLPTLWRGPAITARPLPI